jgi:REP element-mobilizing transposase RayT
MARGARGEIHAGIYHVYTRSAGKIPLFRDDHDRTDFCNRLATTVGRGRVRCLAFALLTTHYHLLLDVPANALQPAMKWLNGTYAQRFNRRHERWGHLCGGRYSCVRVRSGRQLRRAFRYIALNPVRAGLCQAPEDWVWSSYAGTAELRPPVFRFIDDAAIRLRFGDEPGDVERLRAFVRQAVALPLPGTVPG